MSDELIDQLLVTKIHQEPGLLSAVPAHLQRRFASNWEPARRVAQTLAIAPRALLSWWLAQPQGHVLIAPEQQEYATGTVEHGDGLLAGVVVLGLAQVLDRYTTLEAVAPLFDHLLGCGGEPEGEWLSSGGGVTPAWREVGRRLQVSFSLGYGPTEQIRAHAAQYFAYGFATYLTDRQALTVTDPALERLLRTTLFDEAFWRRNQPS